MGFFAVSNACAHVCAGIILTVTEARVVSPARTAWTSAPGLCKKANKHEPVSELEGEPASRTPHGGTLMDSASCSCLSSCLQWRTLKWKQTAHKPPSSQGAFAQRDFTTDAERKLKQWLIPIWIKYKESCSDRLQLEFVKYSHIHVDLGANHYCVVSRFKCSFRWLPTRPII